MLSRQMSYDRAICHINNFKGFPSHEIQTTSQILTYGDHSVAKTSQKITIVQQRSFFVRIGIAENRPGHPKSRPQLNLETFNLSAGSNRRIVDLVSQCIEENARSYDKQM